MRCEVEDIVELGAEVVQAIQRYKTLPLRAFTAKEPVDVGALVELEKLESSIERTGAGRADVERERETTKARGQGAFAALRAVTGEW